jgi:hypothetical protein
VILNVRGHLGHFHAPWAPFRHLEQLRPQKAQSMCLLTDTSTRTRTTTLVQSALSALLLLLRLLRQREHQQWGTVHRNVVFLFRLCFNNPCSIIERLVAPLDSDLAASLKKMVFWCVGLEIHRTTALHPIQQNSPWTAKRQGPTHKTMLVLLACQTC